MHEHILVHLSVCWLVKANRTEIKSLFQNKTNYRCVHTLNHKLPLAKGSWRHCLLNIVQRGCATCFKSVQVLQVSQMLQECKVSQGKTLIFAIRSHDLSSQTKAFPHICNHYLLTGSSYEHQQVHPTLTGPFEGSQTLTYIKICVSFCCDSKPQLKWHDIFKISCARSYFSLWYWRLRRDFILLLLGLVILCELVQLAIKFNKVIEVFLGRTI